MQFNDFKYPLDWSNDELDIYKSFYKEIWHEKEYDRFGVCIESNDVVLDLGASIGLFSQWAISKGASKVIALECNDKHYEYLIQNISDNIHPIKGLVSNSEWNLEKIYNEMNITSVDFAKIDIEGWEYDLLLNTPDYIFNTINKFAIELHVWGMFKNDVKEFVQIMQLLEKLSKNGYCYSIERIHTNTNLYMLYAKKINKI